MPEVYVYDIFIESNTKTMIIKYSTMDTHQGNSSFSQIADKTSLEDITRIII
jgi:hypothetical protein